MRKIGRKFPLSLHTLPFLYDHKDIAFWLRGKNKACRPCGCVPARSESLSDLKALMQALRRVLHTKNAAFKVCFFLFHGYQSTHFTLTYLPIAFLSRLITVCLTLNRFLALLWVVWFVYISLSDCTPYPLRSTFDSNRIVYRAIVTSDVEQTNLK